MADPDRPWQSDFVGSFCTAVFWISALAAWAGSGLFLSRIVGLPQWIAVGGGFLISVVFGFAMAGAFLTLRGVREWWMMAPAGNPGGTPVGEVDLLVLYLIVGALLMILLPVFSQARHVGELRARRRAERRHQPYRPGRELVLPTALIGAPFGLAGAMAAAAWWSRRTRPLHHAALAGDLPGVLARLERGTDPDSEDPYTGRTPLYWAILEGQSAVVGLLLEQGVDPNRPSRWGDTPLQRAAFMGQAEIVQRLLDAGADPSGPTLIDGAVFGPVVRVLLEAGADVNARLPKGATALIEAAAHSRGGAVYDFSADPTESVRLLLAHGADVNASDESGRTALIEAAPFPGLVRLLLDAGAAVDARTAEGVTPLIRAVDDWRAGVRKQQAEVVASIQLLLAHGADVNARDGRNRTALTVARQRARQEVVQALLAAGATE